MDIADSNITGPVESHGPAAAGNAMDRARWSDSKYNGKTIHLESDETGEEYVLKWPQSHHISRYAREAAGGNALKASRNLVLSLVLYPLQGDLETRFAVRPGLPIALGNEIGRITGITEEFTSKN